MNMLEVDAEQILGTIDDKKYKQKDGEPKKEDSVHNKETPYPDLMPEEEFYDAAILYSEKDYEKVKDLMKIITSQIVFENNESPKIDLFDVILPTGQMSLHMELLIDRCSCIILYLTEAYLDDSFLLYQSNELLMNSVQNRNTYSGSWQIMLLTNTPRDVPIGMKSLCVTKWYIHRDLAIRKLKKILQNAQAARKRKEKHFGKRRGPSYDLLRVPSYPTNPLIPSPEISTKPAIYHIYNSDVNYCYNVDATNVQIGEHSKMYGVTLASPDPPIPENPESITARDKDPQNPFQVPMLKRVQALSDSKMEEEVNFVRNISKANVDISASFDMPTQPNPDSTTKKAKEYASA